MKKFILLIAMSSALFSMNAMELEKSKNDIGKFIGPVSSWRDMSLTCEQVREFFLDSTVDQSLMEIFLSSREAEAIVAAGTTVVSNKGDLAAYEIETFYAGLQLVAHCEQDAQKRGIILSTAYTVLRNAINHLVSQVDATLQASALRSTGENALGRAVNTLDEIKKLLDLQRNALEEQLAKVETKNN